MLRTVPKELCSSMATKVGFAFTWAKFWYNTTFYISTGMTPFQSLYSRPPPHVPMDPIESSPVHKVDQVLKTRDELLIQLKTNLAVATNRIKQTVDKNRREVEFQEIDMVYLKLHPYMQSSVFKLAHHKLASRFFRSYQILQKISSVAYKLHLPEGAQIHLIFHVSLLKKVVGDLPKSITELPPIDNDGVLIRSWTLVGLNVGVSSSNKI